MTVTLALDLATKTGFAVHRRDGRIESGVASFQPKANEGEGQRYVRFRRWLVEMKQTHDVDRIVYEKVMGHGAFQVIAAHVYGGLLATLQAFGEHHQIAYDGFAVTTIKKRWTGSGKADKAMMVSQCKALGFNPKDHNEADAIALLHVALDRCPVLTPSPKPKAAKALKSAGVLPVQPF